MLSTPARSFNLPWHQAEHYWLNFYAAEGALFAPVAAALKACGAKEHGEGFILRTGAQWKPSWDAVYVALAKINGLYAVDVGLSFADIAPANRVEAECKTTAKMQDIANSMWLGDALLENRVVCYLQSVHSNRDRIFGYESFARVNMPDGTVVAGMQIMEASKILGIEHMIDRHLHVEAINTFAASAFNGFLFVNFSPGFIHRPAVYLEGLSETAKQHGIVSKHIVLDLTNSERPRDMAHIKNVCDYGRSRGYSVALDDVASVDGAQKLVHEVRPDFVKIDMHLVQAIESPNVRDTIRMIVELVHASGGTVIAEGVETEAMFNALKMLGVDLYQGYLFSAPEPVSVALKRSGAAAG